MPLPAASTAPCNKGGTIYLDHGLDRDSTHAEHIGPGNACGSRASQQGFYSMAALVRLKENCYGSGRDRWRGAGVVEQDGLENRYTRKGIEGSNPSLSASS